MLLAPTVQLLALMMSAPGVGAAGPILRAAGPELVFTRQTLFSIPFRIDRTTEKSREPVEVRLYVSTDQGATWQLYSTVPPVGQHFLFRAGSDGEYWFLVRTLDRSGRLRPEGRGGPELRVVVDTKPPQLKLQAERGRAGQVTARWEAGESYPKANSLKIQYRIDSNGPWEFVALNRQATADPNLPKKAASQEGPTSQEGEVTWWPQAKGSRIEIRAEMTDMAGNPAVSHAQVGTAGGPVIDPTGDHPATDRRASSPGWQPATRGIGTDSSESEGPSSDLLVAETSPAVGDRFIPSNEPSASGNQTEISPDEQLQIVNSLRFELDYDVESAASSEIGPSEIGRVELWGTRDGGLSWRSFGVDEDKQSPIRVTVPDEGRYGFRAVVGRGTGSASESPRSGEAADVWIGVDVTKPAARIVSATLGTGDRAGHLVICWEATDEKLAARSVLLQFGGTPRGPWSTIASGLDNTGSHEWPLDGQPAGRVYLRLEVRDRAGNIGSFQTPEPVLLSPAVRIRNVRPLANY